MKILGYVILCVIMIGSTACSREEQKNDTGQTTTDKKAPEKAEVTNRDEWISAPVVSAEQKLNVAIAQSIADARRGQLDAADEACRRLMTGNSDQKEPLLWATLSVVEGWLNAVPPRPERAGELLVLAEAVEDSDGGALSSDVRSDLDMWRLVVDLFDATPATFSDEAVFQQWHSRVDTTMTAFETVRLPRHTQPIENALARLVVLTDKDDSDACNRIERVLVKLQQGLRCPSLLRDIQKLRVELLERSGRFDDALYECRVLLAASSLDHLDLLEAIEKTAAILKHSDHKDIEERFRQYQQCGKSGEDWIEGTADDMTNPLAAIQRANGPVVNQANLPSPNAKHKQDQWIAAASRMIVTGQAIQIQTHLESMLTERPPDQTSARVILSLAAIAQAYDDGHSLNCHEPLKRIITNADQQADLSGWREGAQRFLNERVAMAQALLDIGHPAYSLGMCRELVNDRLSQRLDEELLSIGLSASRALAQRHPILAIEYFQQLGRSLSSTDAITPHTLLTVNDYIRRGAVLDAIAYLEMLSSGDAWPRLLEEPNLNILHLGHLVRSDEVDEAAIELKSLIESIDNDHDVWSQAMLLLGVLHVRQGDLETAYITLRHLIDVRPDSEQSAQAAEILSKL